ncbi:microfibril-associated glycoprotein 4-like [Patiria miniata]|uniref:Uncharacterized protein n=1 Tax=Patiria miniata TaxID=46514 RepID=A0A914ASE8_PATMI|nr:microfibril-associated glycoprotein 4-like [Patiria miniata]
MELPQILQPSGLKSQIVVLFMSLLIASMAFCFGSPCTGQTRLQFYGAENRALNGSVYETTTAVSPVACTRNCHADVRCMSLNYYWLNSRCELSTTTRSQEPSRFTERQGSVYFDSDEGTQGFSVPSLTSALSTPMINEEAPDLSITTTTLAFFIPEIAVDPIPNEPIELPPSPTENPTTGCKKQGVNTIYPSGTDAGIQVDCELIGAEYWMVIQRRQDGSVDFYRNWTEYRDGFGDLSGEYWLGNDKIRRLTESQDPWMLRVDLADWYGQHRWVLYNGFSVLGEEYTLQLGDTAGTSHSDISDSFDSSIGRSFSTWDHDNDRFYGSCAEDRHGGWWYDNCVLANLNGFYFQEQTKDNHAIMWYRWKEFNSLKQCSMKIQRGEMYLGTA